MPDNFSNLRIIIEAHILAASQTPQIIITHGVDTKMSLFGPQLGLLRFFPFTKQNYDKYTNIHDFILIRDIY